MRHRLRTVVWRELPYSARRSIVGLLRAIDDFEDFWRRVWQSFHLSPAWLFVAAFGSLGIVLTILLFFLLTQELLAARSPAPSAPIVEWDVPVDPAASLLDSRLCVTDVPRRPEVLPADFGFDDRVLFADQPTSPRRPPRRRSAPPLEPDFPDFSPPEADLVPVANRETRAAAPVDGAAELDLQLEWWRQPSRPETTKRPVTVTGRSEERSPVMPPAYAIGGDVWGKFQAPLRTTVEAIPYTGNATVVMETPDERLWEDAGQWPTRSDVAVRLELRSPEQASIGQPQRDELIVRNIGDAELRRIEVQEPIHPLNLVTHAEPAAMLQDHLLKRELRRLQRGREKTLSLDWHPASSGDRHHEALVIAEAYVAATVAVAAAEEPAAEPPAVEEPAFEVKTEEPPMVDPQPPATEPESPFVRKPPKRRPIPSVETPPEEPVEEPMSPPVVEPEPPAEPEPQPVTAPLAEPEPPQRPVVIESPPTATPEANPVLTCDVVRQSSAQASVPAEIEIEVANPGATPLTAVRVWADLPPSLHHRHGQRLELVLGDLPAGYAHYVVLRFVPEQAGTAIARVRALAAEAQSPLETAELDIAPGRIIDRAPARRLTVPSRPCPCASTAGWTLSGF